MARGNWKLLFSLGIPQVFAGKEKGNGIAEVRSRIDSQSTRLTGARICKNFISRSSALSTPHRVPYVLGPVGISPRVAACLMFRFLCGRHAGSVSKERRDTTLQKVTFHASCSTL
jgi:hypothetical protein